MATEQGRLPFRDVSPELKSDPDIVMEAIHTNPANFRFACPILTSDKAFVLQAVTFAGECLAHASPELQGDVEVVLAAVKQDGRALQYASTELRNEKIIVLSAVKKTGSSLEFASPELKNDVEIMIFAIHSNPDVLEKILSKEQKGILIDTLKQLKIEHRDKARLQLVEQKIFSKKLPDDLTPKDVSGNKVPGVIDDFLNPSIPPEVIKKVIDSINTYYGDKLVGGSRRKSKSSSQLKRKSTTQRVR